jgi:hypothetical protein
LAPWDSAIRDITTACAWCAIMPCMNSTSALVYRAPFGITISRPMFQWFIPAIPPLGKRERWAADQHDGERERVGNAFGRHDDSFSQSTRRESVKRTNEL